MKRFLAKLQNHHQVEIERSNAKILVVYVRSVDGSMGVDMFEDYEEINDEEIEYYINQCNDIRILERW